MKDKKNKYNKTKSTKRNKSTINSCYSRFQENICTIIFSLLIMLVGVIAFVIISNLCNLNVPAALTLQNIDPTWIVASILTLVVSGVCCSAIPSRNN